MNHIRRILRPAGLPGWWPASCWRPSPPRPPLSRRSCDRTRRGGSGTGHCRGICHPTPGLPQAPATAAPSPSSRSPGRRRAGLADRTHHGSRRSPRCRSHPVRTGAGSQAAPSVTTVEFHLGQILARPDLGSPTQIARAPAAPGIPALPPQPGPAGPRAARQH